MQCRFEKLLKERVIRINLTGSQPPQSPRHELKRRSQQLKGSIAHRSWYDETKSE